MNVGVLLPTFQESAQRARASAHVASDVGLDGVFAYDHLWPMGHRERPSLAPFPLLAAVAAREARLVVAPLVARVGLVGTDVLVQQYETLLLVAPSRVLATFGTGDRLSEEENVAYGVTPTSADHRRELIAAAVHQLGPSWEVWIGAGAPATNSLARSLGATLNVWDKPASDVALAALDGLVSWAGNPRDDLEKQLDELRDAGATWAVFAPTVDLPRLGAWRRGSTHAR